MLKERTFNVVVVSRYNGTGVEIATKFNNIIKYSGKEISVKFKL